MRATRGSTHNAGGAPDVRGRSIGGFQNGLHTTILQCLYVAGELVMLWWWRGGEMVWCVVGGCVNIGADVGMVW